MLDLTALLRQSQYLYRAVDKNGDTVDFLLRAKRDQVVARGRRHASGLPQDQSFRNFFIESPIWPPQ